MLELNDTNGPGIVETGRNFFLMFYTDWCPRCPPLMEILEELELKKTGKFQFAKINFDKNPSAREYFKIPGVPVILVIKDCVVLEMLGGFQDKFVREKIIETLSKTDNHTDIAFSDDKIERTNNFSSEKD